MNQFFNHRQFESYRRLGMHQARKAKRADVWEVAEQWQAGQLSDEDLEEALAAAD